ncbi:MAG TPA: hypothetical protein VLI05_06530 [Candidatus Saccharimonadia bacterium]|nr:hypothetical protein [Candidatus Saccharimonadia bacterium]
MATSNMKPYYLAMALIIMVGGGAVVAETQLNIPARADEALALRLDNINVALQTYVNDHDQLPTSLDRVSGDHTGLSYHTVNATDFQLCATFATSTLPSNQSAHSSPIGSINAVEHGRGYQCFTGRVYLPYSTPTILPVHPL